MRLFTAIDIPAPVRERLNALVERLRPSAAIAWSRASNLHITTRFLGECPEKKLEAITEALGAMSPREAIEVSVEGLGWFPNERRPRVLWAGVEGGEALAALAAATNAALEPLGFAPEPKPFSPHLTLARIRDPYPLDGLRRAIASLPTTGMGRFAVTSFHLYQSQPGQSGSVYTRLAEFPFRP